MAQTSVPADGKADALLLAPQNALERLCPSLAPSASLDGTYPLTPTTADVIAVGRNKRDGLSP